MAQCKAEQEGAGGIIRFCVIEGSKHGLHRDMMGQTWGEIAPPLEAAPPPPRIIALLEQVEWGGEDHDKRPLCVICRNWKEDGHFRCELADVLVGLREAIDPLPAQKENADVHRKP